jgi:hypothetical protein
MPPIMASISKKSSNKVPIIIFQMLLAGRQTHNNIELFYGFEGVFMGLIMGSQNIMGSDYGSNISDAFALVSLYEFCNHYAKLDT